MGPEVEQRVRALRSACGCKSGLLAMLASVTAYVVLVTTGQGRAGLAHHLLTGLGVALCGALLGKCAGLLWARVRLVLLLRQISTPR
jgi:hypothetical protein